MRKLALWPASLAPLVLIAATSAQAQQTSGSGALALAALVGTNSPTLGATDKGVLLTMLNGFLSIQFPAGRKIDVKADSVVCRSSNVDISLHACVLTFGAKKVTLTGRVAHELYATIVEVGVPGDGAAGTIYEALKTLACTVDPNAVKQRDGSGAECTFVPGQ